MEVLTLPIRKTSTCLTLPPRAGFACPDLTAFCRLDELGLVVTGQCIESDRAVLSCQDVAPDQWCRRWAAKAARVARSSGGWRTGRRAGARPCSRSSCAATGVSAADMCGARTPRRRQSRGPSCRAAGCAGALEGIVVQHLTVARVAEGLGVAWNTANDAVLAEGKRALIDDEHRFDGVKVIGVDEHVWRHTRHGDKYVTSGHDGTRA